MMERSIFTMPEAERELHVEVVAESGNKCGTLWDSFLIQCPSDILSPV